jgi:pimeloyl-ACP methyl ester carboxylesterase
MIRNLHSLVKLPLTLSFRAFIFTLGFLLGTSRSIAANDAPPPIVFVHGNGDTAALWLTTVWRFESNGWPRDRLHALDLPLPLARDDDAVPQPGRSSTSELARHLQKEVARVSQLHGGAKVVMAGNSRGGLAIRNYIANFGGAALVSHALLGGTPNHGVWANVTLRPGSEFNGAGPFLTALNAPAGAEPGIEVTPGVQWLTIRSDQNDKFAQPDGVWMGAKGMPTGVNYDGPALGGATNVILRDRDHREVSYHAEAFAEAYRFVTGRAPATTEIRSEVAVTLSGTVTGFAAGSQTNLPVPGSKLEIFAVDPATGGRVGPANYQVSVGDDGRWGPFITDSRTHLEFVITAPDHAITHIYRTPFLRSSELIHLRAERPLKTEGRPAALINLSRPRGYFGLPRDEIMLDGKNPPAGIPPGVAGVSTARLELSEGVGRPVSASFHSGTIREQLTGVAWPAAENRIVILELHY